MDRNILVLGGAGFIGTNLCNKLVDSNKVISVDVRKSPKLNSEVIQFEKSFSEIDEINSIINNYHITHVIHCISTLLPRSTLEDFYRDNNLVYNNTVSLLDSCVNKNINFIFLSSGGVLYENSDLSHKENDALNPLSFYALSKLNIENLIHYYGSKYNLNYLIIRPSNPYGFGQRIDGKQGLISTILGKVLNDETLEIWGDGEDVRDYLFIDDFVIAVDKLIKREIMNTCVNIGSGVGYSVNEVIQIVEKCIGKKINVKYTNNILAVKKNVLDITYLKQLIDFTPENLAMGVKIFYEKLKDDKQ